jgi:hypothetical protein
MPCHPVTQPRVCACACVCVCVCACVQLIAFFCPYSSPGLQEGYSWLTPAFKISVAKVTPNQPSKPRGYVLCSTLPFFLSFHGKNSNPSTCLCVCVSPTINKYTWYPNCCTPPWKLILCQPGWPCYPAIWPNIILDVSVTGFSDEIYIEICGLWLK